jgi:uncharacterized protein YjiS (DUF1127 family)
MTTCGSMLMATRKESAMAVVSLDSMRIGHPARPAPRPGARPGWRQLWQLWRRRRLERIELAAFTERNLNDVGLSLGDVLHEINKPFWRA